MAKTEKYSSTAKKQLYNNNDNIDGKLQPQSVDLEMAVLGACLLESDALSLVVDILTPNCFYVEGHNYIWDAMLELYAKSQPIDLLTVSKKLKANDKFDLVGGSHYIGSLTDKIVGSSNIETHARIVVEDFLKRELIRIGSESIQNAYDTGSDVFDVYEGNIQKLESSLTGVMKYEVSSIGSIHDDLLFETIKVIESGKNSGVPTGYPNLDKFTNGWQKSDLIIIAGRPAMGKALKNTELVITPTGSIEIGNAKIGMEIMGSDGLVYKITGVHPQGLKEVFRVSFDDYTFVDCCDEHLWEVTTRLDRQSGDKNRVSVLKTKDMINRVILSAGRKNYAIKINEPLNFKAQDTTVHPYLLGVYLGDGYSKKSSVHFCNSEKGIIDKIKTLLPVSDELSTSDKLHYNVIRKVKTNKTSDLHSKIKSIELIGKKSYEKFIPKNYLYNTIEVRTLLLQGLVDTDGFVTISGNSSIEYSTTSLQLCEDILELVRGLGGKATYQKKQGSYRDKNGEKITVRFYYRMYLSLPPEIMPVSSLKHLAKYSSKKRYHKKFIVSIEKMNREEEMTCITVDAPDHLFITSGYNLTHNSVAGLALALNPAIQHNIPTAIFSIEMSKKQVVGRAQSTLSGVNSSDIIKKNLTMEDVRIITDKCTPFYKAPIYIDDTPALSLQEFKGKARKLVRDKGVQLIVVDYLQLMTCEVGKGNREQEVGTISKGLKAIAKELDIPIIALAQLSRAVETRGGDKKPILSDLRESGCVTGDTLIQCPKTKKIVRIEDLVGNEKISVLATNYKANKSVKAKKCWYTGKKVVHELELSNGMKIKATGNHKFLTEQGWIELKDLDLTKHKIAVPINYDNSDGEKIDLSDVFNKYSLWDKNNNNTVIQNEFLFLNKRQTILLLKTLFGANGHVLYQERRSTKIFNVFYSSSNENLIKDVQILLLKVGIMSCINVLNNKSYNLYIRGNKSIECFVKSIGFFDKTKNEAMLNGWKNIKNKTKSHKKFSFNEENTLCFVSIEKRTKLGTQKVYDIEVDKLHNFTANGMIVHNSMEQDADMVIFVHRPQYYGQDTYEYMGNEISADGLLLLLVAKHRAGGLGDLRFGFNGDLTRMEDYNTFMSNKNAPHYQSKPSQSGTTTYEMPKEAVESNKIAENTSFLSERSNNLTEDDVPF